VTVVNPVRAGGQSEPIGRIVNAHFKSVLGQPFVMENRVGAEATIGAVRRPSANPTATPYCSVRRAPLRSRHMCTDRSLTIRSPNLAPIIALTEAPTVLVAEREKRLSESRGSAFGRQKRARRVTVASAGIGSFPHVFRRGLCIARRGQLTHVPYRGGGPR